MASSPIIDEVCKMGATLWFHEVPWQTDPKNALQQLQAELFKSKYRFPDDLEAWKHDTQAAHDSEKATGDQFGLVDVYASSLKQYRKLMAPPLPTDPMKQLAIVRKILDAGEGLGSILDVTNVNAKGGHHITRVLPAADIARFTGSEKPQRDAAMNAVSVINAELDRGESFAFPIYDPAGNPTHWFFIGNTVD